MDREMSLPSTKIRHLLRTALHSDAAISGVKTGSFQVVRLIC